jgi:hypothetical protein
MDTTFKEKNEEIFKSFTLDGMKIKWFDNEGIWEHNDVFVSFRIHDVGTHHNYNGYYVDIYSKKTGLLKSKFFRFYQYLPLTHIWLNSNKFEWYPVIDGKHIPLPTKKELEYYVSEIIQYIKMIR